MKLEHSSAETIWVIQKAFGDNAVSAEQIKVWHKLFKDDLEPVKVTHVWEAWNKQTT